MQIIALRGLILLLLLGFHPKSKLEAQAVTSAGSHFKTHFQDESQFIVESILTDIVEMAAYAKSNQFPADISVVAIERKGSLFRMPTYDVDVVIGKSRALQIELQVKQPIWSPD